MQDEDVKRGVSVSEHPVENGLKLTDNVRRNPIIISIRGEIVGANASDILKKITDLHQKGQYVKYVGQNILSNAIITSFDTSHPNTIYGGCSFTMEITEIRIAKSPYKKKTNAKKTTKKNAKKQKASKYKKYKVKKGDTLWGIARKYYGSGAQYPLILNANKSKIPDVYKLKIGITLKIPV